MMDEEEILLCCRRCGQPYYSEAGPNHWTLTQCITALEERLFNLRQERIVELEETIRSIKVEIGKLKGGLKCITNKSL